MLKKIYIGILIISVLVLGGCSEVCPEPEPCPEFNASEMCETCEECPEEVALIEGVFDSWGENIDNSKELIFSFGLVNFGYVEAKNVYVTCYVEENNRKILKETKNMGNVGSLSTTYKDMIVDNTIKENSDQWGFCYISSCESCEILNERIPELYEVYK